jgi:hypothetical protein
MRALVVMLVSTHDHVHPVAIEERQERLADTPIAAVGVVRRGDSGLMHADHDPVDAGIGARSREGLLEPGALCTPTVAAHVAVPAVLVADVVVGEGHHADRAGGEGVPEPAPLLLAAVVGQREPSLVCAVAERAVATFVLVVARRRHPWSVARRPRVVLEEV